MFGPLLLLLPLITPALLQVNDREYNKICPRNDDMVTLPSGNKVRYLCDDCLLDPKAKYISPTTIEECADIGSIAKDCKATMWSGGKCWCTDMSYTGSSNPTSKGCIWMTSETRSGKQDDCTTCLNEKKECVDKRRQCEDNLKHCNPDDKDCEKKARKCQDDLISCESEKEKYIKKERKCQDDLTGCENEKDSCVKKGRRCQNDLITCENDKDGCDKRERRCSDDQASCEKEKSKCLKEQEKCQSDRQDSQGEADRLRRLFNDCTDDLDKCKKSSSSWGGTDGKIKCKAQLVYNKIGSMLTSNRQFWFADHRELQWR